MIGFDLRGIRVEARAKVNPRTYKDANHRERTRFDRKVRVSVQFWEFTIENGDLYEVAFVRSVLSYFMHAYWKRSSHKGSRIDLAKVLQHEDYRDGRQSVHFVARQKNKQHFLHIFLAVDGETLEETYLDGQEVIMLEIAVGKAISLMVPDSHFASTDLGDF